MKGNLLLEQIRSISQAFLKGEDLSSSLQKGIQKIAELSAASVLILDQEGTVLAGYLDPEKPDSHLQKAFEEGSLAGEAGLLAKTRTGEPVLNEAYSSRGAGKKDQKSMAQKEMLYSVIPIKSGTKRLAAMLISHQGPTFDPDKQILAEVGAALIGMLLLHAAADRAEEEARNRELAEVAFESLSYSEVEAIREILKNISNNESIVVASKIADSLGITRSVIVNALRKFESAGIIESRSLGMKGTFIRVKNLHALEIVASRSAKLSLF